MAYYIDYSSWNINSVASLVSFLATFAYAARQRPGQIYLAKMAAWHPNLSEAATFVLKQGHNFALKKRATLLDPARRTVVKPLATMKHGQISESAVSPTPPSALKEQGARTNKLNLTK